MKKAFTLIELLIVIAIIGILATFIVASFSSAQAKARDSRRKADLDAIRKALYFYKTDHNTFPPGDAGTNFGWATQIQGGCDASVYNALINGNYMKTVPDDPKAPSFHYRYRKVDDDHFFLESTLENTNDAAYQTDNTNDCTDGAKTWHYILTQY